MTKKGFTLVEILVAVVIIVVLVSITAPAYLKSVARTRATELLGIMTEVKKRQQIFYTRNNQYSKNFKDFNHIMKASNKEKLETTTATIGKYSLYLNTSGNCLCGYYHKGKADGFKLAVNYTQRKVGCEGNVCSSLDQTLPLNSVCSCN